MLLCTRSRGGRQGDCVSKILRENDLRFRQLMPVGFVLNFSLFHKSDFTG